MLQPCSKKQWLVGFVFLLRINFYSVRSQHTNLTVTPIPGNEKFVIQLGGLYTIYSRGTDENCNRNSPIPFSIEASLKTDEIALGYKNKSQYYLKHLSDFETF